MKIYDIKNKFDLNEIYIYTMNGGRFSLKFFENIIYQARAVVSFGFIKEEEINKMLSNINVFKSII
jgi:hypothetical protein